MTLHDFFIKCLIFYALGSVNVGRVTVKYAIILWI